MSWRLSRQFLVAVQTFIVKHNDWETSQKIRRSARDQPDWVHIQDDDAGQHLALLEKRTIEKRQMEQKSGLVMNYNPRNAHSIERIVHVSSRCFVIEILPVKWEYSVI